MCFLTLIKSPHIGYYVSCKRVTLRAIILIGVDSCAPAIIGNLPLEVGNDRRTDHISNSARASIGSPSFRARIPYLHSIEYRLNVERVLNLLNLTRSEPT